MASPLAALRKLAAFFRRARRAPGRFGLRLKAWREYVLYMPSGIETIKRPPLVVWLHGCRQDPEEFASGTRIARYADERGFIVLLPRQSRMANPERCWNWFDRRAVAGGGETAIVSAQAREVIEKFGVDTRRVYIAGLSSGGTLAATVALRSPQLFAAAAFHSAVAAGAAFDAHDAQRVMAQGAGGDRTDTLALESRRAAGAKARVPVLVIQGSADTTVAAANADCLARQFQLFNGGEAAPPAHSRAPHRRAYIESEFYAGRRLAARLVTVPGLGHAWSGGDPAYGYFDDRYLDATALICDFFSSHARSAGAR